MGKLAIIHTTPVTIDVLKTLAQELMPGCAVINYMDDSILPQLAANGGDLREVEPRWTAYARFAEQAGADCVLSACSSVGPLAAVAQKAVAIPVLRIDEAMAERAVASGRRIGVAATLPTTLNPTLELLREKAESAGKPVDLIPEVADRAYRLLLEGDKEGHDRELREMLGRLAGRADLVVLAQASMARAVATLPEAERSRFLSSPRLGMERAKRIIEARRPSR